MYSTARHSAVVALALIFAPNIHSFLPHKTYRTRTMLIGNGHILRAQLARTFSTLFENQNRRKLPILWTDDDDAYNMTTHASGLSDGPSSNRTDE
jgi:hypothetical protein